MESLFWGSPKSIYWFIAVGALVIGYILYTIWKDRIRSRLTDQKIFSEVLSNTSRFKQNINIILIVLAASCMVLALARPKWGTATGKLKHSGIDICIALDVSKSMLVTDLVPNRLGSAKIEIKNILDHLQGGRVCVIPFAGASFVQTPLTADYNTVKVQLDDLRVKDIPVGGTIIAKSLMRATDVLTGQSEKEKVERKGLSVTSLPGSQNKAIILFTDGEDHEGDPLVAAEYAKKNGIVIYTVGVGTKSGDFVPQIDEEGNKIDIMRYKNSDTPVFSKLDEDLLKKIAEKTGGKYFSLQSQSIVKPLMEEINKLEKQEFESQIMDLREDRFQIFLIPATLLLCLAFLLSDRKRRVLKPWRKFMPEGD